MYFSIETEEQEELPQDKTARIIREGRDALEKGQASIYLLKCPNEDVECFIFGITDDLTDILTTAWDKDPKPFILEFAMLTPNFEKLYNKIFPLYRYQQHPCIIVGKIEELKAAIIFENDRLFKEEPLPDAAFNGWVRDDYENVKNTVEKAVEEARKQARRKIN